jgi:hypothetical protein
MTSTTTARSRAAILFGAPAVLLVGWGLHPYIAVPRPEDVAEAAAADTTRWGLAHLAVGVGSALLALAFVALRSHLREAGENRWSGPALPLAVVGSALTAILTGMEFAPLAAAETGGDVTEAQEELAAWFIPVVAASGLAFALGAVGFAIAIARSRILGRRLARVVVAALVTLAAARFVPLGAAFYVSAVAAVVALWPLAYLVWEPQPTRARGPRPTPVT